MKETVSAPIAPPVMVPTPPQVGVPPTKTEAIAGRRYADLGRRRDHYRRRDRRTHGLFHPERNCRGWPQWLLCPILQRPDHHSRPARTSLEPESLSVG